ncbi:hypothetical protein [Caballeronia sp. RCC_10]
MESLDDICSAAPAHLLAQRTISEDDNEVAACLAETGAVARSAY